MPYKPQAAAVVHILEAQGCNQREVLYVGNSDSKMAIELFEQTAEEFAAEVEQRKLQFLYPRPLRPSGYS